MTRPDRSRIRGALIDVPVSAVLTQQIAFATLDGPGPEWTGPAVVAWLVAVALGLPLPARRRWPLPVFAFVATVAAAATATGVTAFGVIFLTWIPVALALYSAAAASGRTGAVLTLAGALAAPAVTIPGLYLRTGVTPASAPGSEAPLWWQVETGVVVVMLSVAWATGRLIRWRRVLAADTARRLARDAVADERLRIARELHDIVGHSLSLIAVKATVANHIAEERPAETRAALLTIERTSRSALTEIRRLLDILREDDDPAAELAPAPGVGDLPELVERLRPAGPGIDLDLSGAGDLPPAVGLTVYRIVQESLTNVIKHADASRCRVQVRAADGMVHIEVTDDGRGGRQSSRRPGGGQGLIGMRERVTMYGGSLTADTRPEGGFRVVAAIPYTAEEPA
ncbi:sensor histidine kinase [Actinoplanes sp. NPDC023801]|uniref:sensor histidine kinase n=1 Tax=Actinoplanes sp. NPDC023801 TaxID=3154595 RepID=UPI0033E86E60